MSGFLSDSTWRPARFEVNVKRRVAFGSLLCIVSTLGCGGPPEPTGRVMVAGTVLFEGTPLPAGTICFQAKEGKKVATAMVSEGEFSTDRAPIGECIVTVDTRSIRYGNPAKYVEIPAQYAEPSMTSLAVTLDEAGAEDLIIELAK